VFTTKVYLRILFTLFGIIFTTVATYAYYFSKHYPPPLTNHISFDAKLQFIREQVDPNTIDTLIIGSSLALNNIQGIYLEQDSKQCQGVMNLSAYGATTFQAEQMMQLHKTFPNLERVIYSTQYSDFPSRGRKFEQFDVKALTKYMRNELNPVAYEALMLKACQDLSLCLKRQEIWPKEHNQNNKFSFLGFDKTGSVPLHIYGKDIVQHRWKNPHPGIMSGESFEALKRMAKKAKKQGIKFYLVQQPYRAPLAKRKDIHQALKRFASECKAIMKHHGGEFLSLHFTLNLDDQYFADRSHLNDKGSILAAKAIAKFIDKSERWF
jgi:hypothetical protein